MIPDERQPFRVDVQVGRGEARLTPVGELDLVNAPKLERRLRSLNPRTERLVLDLSRLTFMDSAGLHLVISWNALARTEGVAFTVVPGARNIRRVFELTGTAGEISIET